MILNVNSLLCHQSYACFDQTAEARMTRFCYKVALYFIYRYITFDDEIKGNPFEFQAYVPIRLCPKLNWRLGLALFAARFRSYWDL